MHIVVLETGSEKLVSAQRHCRRAGHVVSVMEGTAEGIDHLCDAAFDLLFIDSTLLQAGLGRSIAALRSRKPELALIAVGATGEAAAACLDAGADLVLPDDGDRDLVLASACAAVRRARGFGSSELRAGPLVLDLDSRSCTLNGRPVALSETELRLLEALLLRAGTVVTRSMLLELLYEPGTEPQARTLDLFVHRLRWKLAAPRTPTLIETRRNGFTIGSDSDFAQPVAA